MKFTIVKGHTLELPQNSVEKDVARSGELPCRSEKNPYLSFLVSVFSLIVVIPIRKNANSHVILIRDHRDSHQSKNTNHVIFIRKHRDFHQETTL